MLNYKRSIHNQIEEKCGREGILKTKVMKPAGEK